MLEYEGVTGHQHRIHASLRRQPANSPDGLDVPVAQCPTSITRNVGQPLARLPVRRMHESDNQRRTRFYGTASHWSVEGPLSPWGGACRAIGRASSTAAATASEVMVSVCVMRTSAWA